MAPRITIVDEERPDELAMMQALYARSSGGVKAHIRQMKLATSSMLLEAAYKGYGHPSVGEGGTTTIFIEDVSLLAAKAIQDWPLYAGHEASTRFTDVADQGCLDPVGTDLSAEILKEWMEFYNFARAPLYEHVHAHVPSDVPTGDIEKYCTRICHDILRGFLPAGLSTRLSWHTNFRQAEQKIKLLKAHPLPEVRQIAFSVYQKLHKQYPLIFKKDTSRTCDLYTCKLAEAFSYTNPKRIVHPFKATTTIRSAELKPYLDILSVRPKGDMPPYQLSELGSISCEFLLDYGSFRDLQRHRNVTSIMPQLSHTLGFESWYIDSLPESLKATARHLVKKQIERLRVVCDDPVIRQYYTALGFKVSCRFTMSLASAIYIAELRSRQQTHPTLKKIADHIGAYIKRTFPKVTVHLG